MGAPSALAATHAYTLVISPATVAGGSSTEFNFALTNTSSPGSRLGSANFTAPKGFQVTAASLPKGSPGTAAVVGNVVELRNLALGAQATLDVSVKATSPETCGVASYTWGSAAKVEPNFTGQPLTLDPGESNLTTKTTTDCALQFITEPHSAVVGQDITGTDFDPAGPPVSVDIVDNGGNVVTISAPVTIAVGSNPGGASLGGTTTVDAVAGVASFSDLTLNKPANGYTLAASSPGLTGATSSPFDVSTTATSCDQNQTCQTNVSTSTSDFAVTARPASNDPNAGTLTESADIGTPLQCEDYSAQDLNWFSFLTSSTNRVKVITYTIIPAGPGSELVGSTQFCLGAPYGFGTRSGAPASAGTLPDGSSGFVGLLPNCPASGPCVTSRSKSSDPSSPVGFDIVIRVEIPAGLAGDPWGRA